MQDVKLTCSSEIHMLFPYNLLRIVSHNLISLQIYLKIYECLGTDWITLLDVTMCCKYLQDSKISLTESFLLSHKGIIS